ncbi:hypothetical protein BDV93DRAFT_349568 [Ceratobasidium sp. AG-I]|nr:hypothetical protein BDV93DRAFT_349568 [Ceratobasidium sp. AG-I]
MPSVIPESLYEDAFRLAAQTLKLPDAVSSFDVPQTLPNASTYAGLDHWIASNSFFNSSPSDDRHPYALNLFAPAPISAFAGILHQLGPEEDFAPVENDNPRKYLSHTLGDVERSFEDDAIGSPQEYEDSEQDSQAQDQWEDETEQSKDYGQPRSEGVQSDRSRGIGATKQTHKLHDGDSGSIRLSTSPLDNYISPARTTRQQRTWEERGSMPSGTMATMSGFPNQESLGWLEPGTNGILEDRIDELEHSQTFNEHNIRGRTASSKSSQESMTLLGRRDATRILGPRLFSDDFEDGDVDI